MKFIKRIWLKMRGVIWEDTTNGTTYTLYKTGWVKISDGTSEDMMPITFCSQEFVDKIEKDLAGK